MRFEHVTDMVGGTPHLRVRSPADARLYMKLEAMNPTGSIKDRACVGILEAMRGGELTPSKTLLDASSGNFACAVAYYGRILGHPAHLISNSKLTADKRAFIEYFGASLELIGDFTIDGNRHCRQLAEDHPERYCFLDQLHNPANPEAHYRTTGPEILEEFPEVGMVVASLGSGGSLCGTARFLKQHRPEVEIVAVESAAGTKLPGTGAFDDGDYRTPFIVEGQRDGLFDHAVKITYDDAVRATARLREQGVFCGLQTGGVLHAAERTLRRQPVSGEVVMLSGDSGWKNMEKLMLIDGMLSGSR